MAEITPPSHNRLALNLSMKLLIAFSLVFGVVFALAFVWFYSFSTQAALEQIRGDLTNTLYATIEGIDGDEFAALVSEAVPDPASGLPDQDLRYQKHQQWLDLIHRIEPRANPYTYVKESRRPRRALGGRHLPHHPACRWHPVPGVVHASG